MFADRRALHCKIAPSMTKDGGVNVVAGGVRKGASSLLPMTIVLYVGVLATWGLFGLIRQDV